MWLNELQLLVEEMKDENASLREKINGLNKNTQRPTDNGCVRKY